MWWSLLGVDGMDDSVGCSARGGEVRWGLLDVSMRTDTKRFKRV